MRADPPIVIALAAAVVISSIACKRMQEKAEERAIAKGTGGQVSIDEKKGTLTIVTDSGAVTVGAAATVPDDFPKAVAVYPNAKATFAAKSTDGSGKDVWSLALETSDSREQVVAYYKANMRGFTEASHMDLGTSTMAVYQNAKYDVTLMVAPESGDHDAITLTAIAK